MKHVIDVQTGEVKAGKKKVVLKSNGIGSCVAVAGYDCEKKVAGLAHVMLPGIAPFNSNGKNFKYAKNAIEELLIQMIRLGAIEKNITVSLVGGANVLKRDGDGTGKNNISSIVNILNKKNIIIIAKAVGGYERRTIAFDVEAGKIYFTEGDNAKQLLWKYSSK